MSPVFDIQPHLRELGRLRAEEVLHHQEPEAVQHLPAGGTPGRGVFLHHEECLQFRTVQLWRLQPLAKGPTGVSPAPATRATFPANVFMVFNGRMGDGNNYARASAALTRVLPDSFVMSSARPNV